MMFVTVKHLAPPIDALARNRDIIVDTSVTQLGHVIMY